MIRSDHDIRRADNRTASPYSTGGGGIVFEHTFGATLLAALLLGDSVPGLGDEQTVTSVTFQAGGFSAVDDVVVMGEPRGSPRIGAGRQLSIGVRRNPRIAPSDKTFVPLLASYLRMVQDEWERMKAGHLRLGLVVAAPHSGVSELAALAEIARTQPSDREFRSFVATPRATRASVRQRLTHLDGAVDQARQDAKIELPDGGVSELTWRLLFGLHPIDARLEGADATDRSATVARLRSLAGEASEANGLFSELCRLASRYDPAGAVVDEATLRRDLSGVAKLGRSSSHQQAWEVLNELARRLRDRTGHELRAGGQQLRLERGTARKQLIAAMTSAGSAGRPLVVTGNPDVGKSALVLSAADVLTAQGEEVTSFNLRDLPPSVLEATTTLGIPLPDLVGSMAVSPVRLLLVDGAEAALEDRFELLTELGESARRAGIGLIAVTRADARGRVVDALSPQPAGSEALSEINIDGLKSEEVKEVVAVFPALLRIADEPRSAWLLERPGLVDLLLRADAIAALPDGALSEADVFAVVWSGLVRRSEQNEPGRGSPDGREFALVDLARRQLVGEASTRRPVDSADLPSLRSDGLLLSPGPTAAWSPGDQFATDLIRDFALARLFLTDGWSPLKDAGAPRWALRAARLACQGKFAEAGIVKESVRIELQTEFDALATEYGDRWTDLPLEALITLGSPYDALQQAWPALTNEDGEGLKRLLRLVFQRFTEGLSADATLVEPVVQLLVDHAANVAELPRGIHESANEIEIRWLRGLALRGVADSPNPLRARIRDRLLSLEMRRHDEHEHECLALLGPDLNAAVEERLRSLASEAPGFLAPCVEATVVSVSMASHQPDLLMELAEAYYIDKRDSGDRGYSTLDDGVRHHHRKGGFGMRLASWYYGPFWDLLRTVPWRALTLINRLLDHAARARIGLLRRLDSAHAYQAEQSTTDRDLPGLELELPGIGVRRYVGDAHAWSWYRGSTVGPYASMSALLAVERFVDQAHDMGIDLQVLTARLLKDCHNLAIPGLVVGFLIRHLDEVTDELDPWLAEPMIWELEFGRSSNEGRLHVQGPDPDDLHGRELRRMSPRDVAIKLALRAVIARDEAAITRLRSVADKLVERASTLYGPDTSAPGFEERMTTVRNWSSFLRAESYEAVSLPDGGVGIKYTPPEVSKEFAKQQIDLDRGMQVIRILNDYATQPERRPADVSNLSGDLKLAIELHQQPPEKVQEFTRDAFPAIAAAAIIAFTEDRSHPERRELEWAATTVLQAAMQTPDSDSMDSSFYEMGGDRSAAFAIPCLLLPPFNEDDPSWLDEEDLKLIHDALFRLVTSGSEEVRRRAANGLSRLWSAPCSPGGSAGSQCRHVTGFEAVEASARDCRMGPFDARSQRRRLSTIEEPPAEVLDGIDPEDLLIGRLVAPLIASSMCASSACCVSEQAAVLRDALLRAHAKGAVHWVGKHFQLDSNPEVQEAVAESILGLAGEGNISALQAYVETLMEEPTALYQFLHEVARCATYDGASRKIVRQVWPAVMAHALTALEEGRSPLHRKGRHEHRDRGEAIAALLLRPQIRMNDGDVEATLQHVKGDWLDLDVMEPLIARWLPFAAGIPQCVDSMVGFVDSMDQSMQVSRGLDLILQVVDSQFDNVASHTWLLFEWLEKLKTSHKLQGSTLSKVQVLVDGLAAHGDWRAVRLQKSLE